MVHKIHRTSQTDPLKIAEIRIGNGLGLVGISFCPGKKDNLAMSGAWHRDLSIDLDVVFRWGAKAVVTLIESHEMRSLGVQDMGKEVNRRHMQWFHMPIVDGSTPSDSFESAWSANGRVLNSLLRKKANVFVHCKGGLGRAGTVGAKLLIEAGISPDIAIERVRAARIGAIETLEQEQYVLSSANSGDTDKS